MSHVAKVDIVINDLDALMLAASECGLEFNEGQKTYRWYGRWLNDYNGENAAFRHGIQPEDYGKCEHALSVPGSVNAYEVGVCKNPNGDGYILIWDFYNRGYGLQDYIGDGGEKLMNSYAKHATINYAHMHGMSVEEEVDENGEINLTLYDYT